MPLSRPFANIAAFSAVAADGCPHEDVVDHWTSSFSFSPSPIYASLRSPSMTRHTPRVLPFIEAFTTVISSPSSPLLVPGYASVAITADYYAVLFRRPVMSMVFRHADIHTLTLRRCRCYVRVFHYAIIKGEAILPAHMPAATISCGLARRAAMPGLLAFVIFRSRRLVCTIFHIYHVIGDAISYHHQHLPRLLGYATC